MYTEWSRGKWTPLAGSAESFEIIDDYAPLDDEETDADGIALALQ